MNISFHFKTERTQTGFLQFCNFHTAVVDKDFIIHTPWATVKASLIQNKWHGASINDALWSLHVVVNLGCRAVTETVGFIVLNSLQLICKIGCVIWTVTHIFDKL